MEAMTYQENQRYIKNFISKQSIKDNTLTNSKDEKLKFKIDKDGTPIINMSPNTNLIFQETPISNKYLSLDAKKLKHYSKALNYILNAHGTSIADVTLHLMRINKLVAPESFFPGQITPEKRKIAGLPYNPPEPSISLLQETIKHCIVNDEPKVVQALHLGLQIIRHQFFYEGNRRTGWIIANYWLLQHGCGFFNIKSSQAKQWVKERDRFYVTGKMAQTTRWLIHNCMYPKRNSSKINKSK